jgi:4-amino-4-deoxy-L-arabinose transferase-like glycosyltransferase
VREELGGPLDAKLVRRGLWVVLGLAAVLPLVFWLGPRYGDHFEYVRLASEIVRGDFRPSENRYSQRFGFLLPMAASQAIFGSWPVASTVLTILASLAHVWGVFALGRSFAGSRVGLCAAALVAVLPLETINGSTPFPDLLNAALGTWALVLVHEEGRSPGRRPWRLLAAGALLGWGYFVKQTIVFHLLLIAAWAVSERRWRWGWVAAPVALALAVEAAVLAAFTGNAFLRTADAREDAAPLLEWWYPHAGGLVARIVWQVPSLLFNPVSKDFPQLAGLAWLFVAALPGLRSVPGGAKPTWAAGILLFQVWFWPNSLSPYVPALLAEGRHMFPLCAPLAVGAAVLFARVSPKRRTLLFAAWGAACLVCTLGIYLYLSRHDAGLREAHRFLKSNGVASVRALDLWGNAPGQLRYLEGPDGKMRVRSYSIEDLETMKDEVVVVDDRTRVKNFAAEPVTTGRELQIPPRWTPLWERGFPERWDPRDLFRGRGRGPAEYRIRIFRAP